MNSSRNFQCLLFVSISRYPDERSDSIDVWDEIIDSRSAFVDDITGQCSDVREFWLSSSDCNMF